MYEADDGEEKEEKRKTKTKLIARVSDTYIQFSAKIVYTFIH